MKKIHILLLASVCLAVACIKDPVLNETKKLSLNLPTQPAAYYEASSDPTINHKAQLGRVLFYEKQLSLNNTISCGSCHKQAFAFADNERFSKGLENKRTSRNSPPLQDFSNVNVFFDNAEGPPNTIDFLPGFGGNEFLTIILQVRHCRADNYCSLQKQGIRILVSLFPRSMISKLSPTNS